MRQGAQDWCTGMTLGMGWGGRWEEGSGWGTHVHPWLIHVNVWQKPPQYCKAISLQLKKKKKHLIIQKTKIMAPKSLQMVTAAMKFKDTCPLEEKL